MSPGSRPVARDQHPQAVDAAAVAATQNTLNYALGNLGGRQKAWMSTGTAVSPANALHHPATTRRASRAPKPQSNHQPPSNTTSPQLANVLAQPTANRPLVSPSAVLPSPAPSEEAERTSMTPTLQSSSAPTTDGAQETAAPQHGAGLDGNATPDVMNFREMSRAAAGMKRPANTNGAESDKRVRIQNGGQPPPLRTTLQQSTSLRTNSPVVGPSSPSPSQGSLHQQLHAPLPYQSPYAPQANLDVLYYQQRPNLVAGRTMPEAHVSYGPLQVLPPTQPTPIVPSNAYAPNPSVHPSSQTLQRTQLHASVLSRQPPPALTPPRQPPLQQMHHPMSHYHTFDPTIVDERGRVGSRGRPRGRPRLYPTPPRPHLPQQQVAPPPQAELRRGRLLPEAGFREPQQRQPNPARFSLHQAHLRSPILETRSPERLFQYVKAFLKPPVRVPDAGHQLVKWTFKLSAQDMERIPKISTNSSGDPPTRLVDEHSRLLRLRCAKWPPSWRPPTEHTWATAETSWIPFSYFTFNGKNLEQRKKLHHGKDLPIDLSAHVKEGENVLEIAILRQNDDDRYLHYLLAIETLGFKSHATIVKQCKERRYIDAQETVERIKQKLAPADDDDEITIVESSLTIKLFDPFSASKICDIPVRSRACLHYDCFDLDTFLMSRRSKGGATMADQWKCPICNSDARPDTLIVDGFLDSVRSKLLELGLADTTRAIVMNQDGSWQPKAETRDPNGVQDRDSPDGDTGVARPAQRQSSTHAEVIDLSD